MTIKSNSIKRTIVKNNDVDVADKEKAALARMFRDDIKSNEKKLKRKAIDPVSSKLKVKRLPEGEFHAIVLDIDYLKDQESKYGRTDVFNLKFGIYYDDHKFTLNERLYKGGKTSKYYRWFKELLGADPYRGFLLEEIIGKEVLATVENNVTQERIYQNIVQIEALNEDVEEDEE